MSQGAKSRLSVRQNCTVDDVDLPNLLTKAQSHDLRLGDTHA